MRLATVDCYDYVRRYYRVPAYIGVRVKVRDREGVLVDARHGDQYLHVTFDGDKRASIVHPTDGVTYLLQGVGDVLEVTTS